MNIIELVKKILTDYPKIEEFTNKIHVDFTKNDDVNFGLSSTGDTKVKEDFWEIRQEDTVLFCMQSIRHLMIMTDFQIALFCWNYLLVGIIG